MGLPVADLIPEVGRDGGSRSSTRGGGPPSTCLNRPTRSFHRGDREESSPPKAKVPGSLLSVADRLGKGAACGSSPLGGSGGPCLVLSTCHPWSFSWIQLRVHKVWF